jgi:uncharacterized protein (TIGR02246 family)
MRTPAPVLSVLTALFVLTASGPAAAAEPDEAAIRNVVARFVEAWNQHDAHAFSLVFSETADFTNVRGVGASGRAAIEAFHAPVFQTMFKASHQTAVVKSIRFIKPDVAAVDVLWEMTGSTDRTGVPIALRKGLLSFVMTKQADQWSILVMHNMDLPAEPPPSGK